jgi:hypothetical protein
VTVLPYAITALLLLAIVFQGYQRYRRIKSSLPPPSPADRGVRIGWAAEGRGEWWKRAAIVLTTLAAGFLVWQKLTVDHRGFTSALPAVLAGVLGLSAILHWLRSDKSKTD